MRLIAAFFVMVLSIIPGAGRTETGLAVDAGTSLRTDIDASFSLEAVVEDAAGPVTVAWTAPDGCTIDTPASLVTTGTCTTPGIHAIAVSIDDGSSSASDEVRIVTVLETEHVMVTIGTVGPGIPDELTPGSGTIDGANVRVPIEVPSEAASLDAILTWDLAATDLDLSLENPDGEPDLGRQGETLQHPETVSLWQPSEGTWTGIVRPKVSVGDSFTLETTVVRRLGDTTLPTLLVRGRTAVPGEVVVLDAEITGGTAPFSVAWESDPSSIRYDDGTGGTFSFAYATPTAVRAKVTDAAGLEAVATAFVRDPAVEPRPLTVIGVVDNAFTPYHFDFVGSEHPWNTDADPLNDIDLTADPATYIDGYPGATPLEVSVPTAPGEIVEGRDTGVDEEVWDGFIPSSLEPGHLNLYRFPGTKIIGAVNFTTSWVGENSSHGTRSAASAAGNIHGACPECLVVLITGGSEDGLRWAAAQDWIDVVTNSYGNSTTLVLRDNIYLNAPVTATRAASEAGQTIVFSAGNGLANAYDVPMLTFWSSEKGPDWTVTVGAVTPDTKQTYLGHGKPVDISSIGSAYPSTGGGTAAGTGTHSGTSNAAPVVAGTIAAVIQEARELLGDTTVTHADGVVASGAPVACGDANPDCVLADGVLTRQELHDLVLRATEHSPSTVDVQTIPSGEHAYYYQGHGVVRGRIDGEDPYRAERLRYAETLAGESALPPRPEIEERWFVVDSFCRQRLWGAWSGGRYRGTVPALDPQTDPFGWPLHMWCSQMPERAFAALGND